MQAASRSSWKTNPLPTQRQQIELSLLFTDTEGEKLRQGHIPSDMDDKWFIFFEAGWLYFHRSWTGNCIFGVRLDGSPAGVRVVQAWASRDEEQYRSQGVESDLRLLQQLIASHLLA